MQSSIIYPNVTPKDVVKAFWRGIKPQRMRLFVLVICVILGNITTMIVPLFYKQFFDIVVKNQNKLLIAPQLVKIIVIVAGLNGFIWIFYRVSSMVNIPYQTKTMALLHQQSYDYLMEHSYSFFASNFTGSLVQRVNRFARSFERLSDRIIDDFLPLTVRVVSIFIIVFFINRLMAFIILAWALIFLLFNILFYGWKLQYDVRVAEIDSKTTGYLADTITNHNTVSLFTGLDFEKRGYRKTTNEQARAISFSWGLNAIIDAVQGFLSFTIEFLLFFFAIQYWQQGLLTVGVFVLLQAYLISLIYQIWDFRRTIRDVYQSYADAKEMVEILKLPHEIKDIPNAKDLNISRGEIAFEHLQFSFYETRDVLQNINLVIRPGEKVALIGPSGAGKTTFVRLLLRLYAPTAGHIFIDGQDIERATQESLRENISMVPQDPVLFHRTLAENIGYGKRDATRGEIEKAATLAHCDEFIKDLPQGLETYVGERGVKLSGGERQRVAIARAMIKAAPILILDEATSSLDSHSEMLIRDALNNLMQGRTTIVIAHRLSTIQKMDRIVVVDNGKIIEEGSHHDLLAKEGSLYRKLWTLQAGGFLMNGNGDKGVQGESEEIIKEDINEDEKEGEITFTHF